MTSDQTGLRAAGAWLAAASILLALALMFHGPLHPDPEVQMMHIAESASRWAAVHWTAAAALSCFAIGEEGDGDCAERTSVGSCRRPEARAMSL